ncbi:hypothetical protein K431DRAFT_281689 [Polychaeton citri CBS 116435]|uniref:FAD/NAD(P)-binding domain-containing protein n=1 Tax=Polychaeton citri CBS 116435 TaxID=1314669 RepID=A0A9P4UTH3_9PEZI|nr:hypothetical protein K431DRAFT_281689 [Polychaeton citri CBS 116435]
MSLQAYRTAAATTAALNPSGAAVSTSCVATATPQLLLLSRTPRQDNDHSRHVSMRARPGVSSLPIPRSAHLLAARQARFFSNTAGSSGRGAYAIAARRPMAMSVPSSSVASSLSETRRPTALRNSTASTGPAWDGTYEAVVVGGGPAGITVVGNLLEQRIEPIFWVDERFNGGRVNRCYREVPSNTKVGLFVDFATAVAPFRKIVSSTPSRSRWEEPSESDGVVVGGKPDKLRALRELDQGKGCRLGYAADMCLMLTEGLRKTPGIHSQQAKVKQAVLDDDSSRWTVKLGNSTQSGKQLPDIQAKRLVLCTGSSPNNNSLPVDVPSLHTLDLDCALSPTLLTTTLSPLGPTTIAVIGASHSAILVLMNLYNLASSTKPDLHIRWFTRHPLRYAEYMDGWILHDNTGLKGEAATWAKQNLEPETFDSSDVSKYITKVAYDKGDEKQTFEEHLQGCDFSVQAIGYSRDPIPELKTKAGESITPVFDHETGKFSYSIEGNVSSQAEGKLPTLFGAGIAWPERVKDPHGNVEYAVGFFKFMKFVKKVVPGWQ